MSGWIITAFVLIMALFMYIGSLKSKADEFNEKIIKRYGKTIKKKLTADELEAVSHYYRDTASEGSIDDITWNDLGMDDVYCRINNTYSSIGQEYLYRTLRNPVTDENTLKELDRLADLFDQDEEKRVRAEKVFAGIGKCKKGSMIDYISYLVDIKPGSNVLHYLCLIFFIASLVIITTVNAVVGIVMVIASITLSIMSYYKSKSKIEEAFMCVNMSLRLLKGGKNLLDENIEEIAEYNNRIKGVEEKFSKVMSRSWLMDSGNINGSLVEMVMEYLRMLTHVDLIKFNHTVKTVGDNRDALFELIDIIGLLETSIAVGSFRKSLVNQNKPCCRPELIFDANGTENAGFEVKDVYHPLIDTPVMNSINADNNILLTGSNASGKSTFLKTVAINALLSQTIYTSVSAYYRAPVYRIYSSMALKDSLANNDSYYIVEIKSLKRILDAIERIGNPVLCFIDEVLRGTNTVERIAASSEILKSIKGKNALCLAATHDVELTEILDGPFTNYHFQEEVTDDEVHFNYQLHNGPATTRNAIKLLKMIGYDADITNKAENSALYFLEKGIWKVEK